MLEYEGLTVRDIKRIVNREEATPAAIGLFIVYDAWRRDHKLPHIVTNELLRWIEDKWRFQAYANELDYWIGLGEQLTRLEYGVERAKLDGIMADLDTSLGIIFTHGSLFGAAFYAVYEQAAAAGLQIKIPGLTAKHLEALVISASEISIKGQPTPPQRMEDIRKKAQSNKAYLLAAQSVIGDAAALLAIPGLQEPVDKALDFLRTRTNTRKEQIDEIEAILPKWAKQLRKMVEFEPIEPDKVIEARLERMLSVYLTPRWRDWAQTGVNLRKLADSSESIINLIRNADIAAVEIKHE